MTLQPEANPEDAEKTAAFMRGQSDADLVQIIKSPRVLVDRLPGFSRHHLRTAAEAVVVALAENEQQRRQFERQLRISRTAMWAAWGSAIAGLAAAFAGIVNARHAIVDVLRHIW